MLIFASGPKASVQKVSPSLLLQSIEQVIQRENDAVACRILPTRNMYSSVTRIAAALQRSLEKKMHKQYKPFHVLYITNPVLQLAIIDPIIGLDTRTVGVAAQQEITSVRQIEAHLHSYVSPPPAALPRPTKPAAASASFLRQASSSVVLRKNSSLQPAMPMVIIGHKHTRHRGERRENSPPPRCSCYCFACTSYIPRQHRAAQRTEVPRSPLINKDLPQAVSGG